MSYTNIEKIRMIVSKRGITYTELANRLGISRQHLNNKLHQKNLSEEDLEKIASALDCTYESHFIMNDTNEVI